MSSKKQKNKRHKTKKTFSRHFLGFHQGPKISGPCDNCKHYEYGTAARHSEHWCYIRGYIKPETVTDCADCKKKPPVTSYAIPGAIAGNYIDLQAGNVKDRYKPLYNPQDLPVGLDFDDYPGGGHENY